MKSSFRWKSVSAAVYHFKWKVASFARIFFSRKSFFLLRVLKQRINIKSNNPYTKHCARLDSSTPKSSSSSNHWQLFEAFSFTNKATLNLEIVFLVPTNCSHNKWWNSHIFLHNSNQKKRNSQVHTARGVCLYLLGFDSYFFLMNIY